MEDPRRTQATDHRASLVSGEVSFVSTAQWEEKHGGSHGRYIAGLTSPLAAQSYPAREGWRRVSIKRLT